MRHLTIALGLMTGIGVGLGAGGCLYGSCPEADRPIDLVDARYVATIYSDTTLGAYEVRQDGDLDVDVDLDGARVIIRFVDSADRDIVQTYDIASTEQGWL